MADGFIAAAHARATGPGAGRLLAVTKAAFTMNLLRVEVRSMARRGRTVNSLYAAVKPLREFASHP